MQEELNWLGTRGKDGGKGGKGYRATENAKGRQARAKAARTVDGVTSRASGRRITRSWPSGRKKEMQRKRRMACRHSCRECVA